MAATVDAPQPKKRSRHDSEQRAAAWDRSWSTRPGRTLYLFKADVGTKGACSGACATTWPPLLATGKPTAGTGGHPLDLYVRDKKPGDLTGQGVTGFGAAWYALTPAGNQISGSAHQANSNGASRGGGY